MKKKWKAFSAEIQRLIGELKNGRTNEKLKIENEIFGFIRVVVNFIHQVKKLTDDGKFYRLMENETERLHALFPQFLKFFGYDGIFMENVLGNNQQHPLFHHYLLMCRVLTGFEENIIFYLK